MREYEGKRGKKTKGRDGGRQTGSKEETQNRETDKEVERVRKRFKEREKQIKDGCSKMDNAFPVSVFKCHLWCVIPQLFSSFLFLSFRSILTFLGLYRNLTQAHMRT